jgi:two-component system sensor histidine kinase/response regulator
LVVLMHGEIGLRSEPGRGSAFWFTAELEKQAGEGRNAYLGHHDLVGLKVLAVDDNATNRRILSHQLEGWKMRVETAASGEEALGMLETAAEAGHPYRLALLDVQMPGMDGWMLVRAIQAKLLLAGTRLIILTSFGQALSPDELKASGIEAYLVKPVKQSRLYECVVSSVARSEMDDATLELARPCLGHGLPVSH